MACWVNKWLREGVKMNLKTAKYILALSGVLMILLVLVGSSTKNRFILLGGLAVAFLGTIFWAVFGRCPGCGKYLGRANEKYCPHCGEKIEW